MLCFVLFIQSTCLDIKAIKIIPLMVLELIHNSFLSSGERLEVSVWEGGGQTGAGQRRRQDVLHHREGAAHQRLHLRAQREQQLELRRLHRGHRGGRAHTQRIPRQGHGSLAQGHHAHDQVQRLGHHQGQGSGRQIESTGEDLLCVVVTYESVWMIAAY